MFVLSGILLLAAVAGLAGGMYFAYTENSLILAVAGLVVFIAAAWLGLSAGISAETMWKIEQNYRHARFAACKHGPEQDPPEAA
jgi:hypothetical protein